MKKTHIEELEKINPNLRPIKRFSGGMSNFTYLVEDIQSKEQFVFRYPGNGAYNFVNYEAEYSALKEAYALGLTSETIYFDIETGIKLAKYVEGSNLVEAGVDYELAKDYLKKFHSSNFKQLKPYDHLGRLANYEQLHSDKNENYQMLKAYFIELFNSTLSQYAIKPCHNDSQLANFIISEDKQIFLVDYEYAAINDPIYDIACFGNVDLSNALELLTEFDFDDREDPLLRLYGWRLFQCLQWYNVASYKHDIGLGEALNLDFHAISKKYLTLATTLKSLIDNID